MKFSKKHIVKRFCIITLVIILTLSASGCGLRSTEKIDEIEAFETHLSWLSDSPEEMIEIPGSEKYGYRFSEDALATIYCYIEEDWVSTADARESFEYLRKYIEALEDEFDNVYEAYQSIY